MTPFKHQLEISQKAYEILKTYMIVYLAMEERTGKTLTSILVAEKCQNTQSILIITKKKALGGWQDTLNKFKHTKNYTITNYEQTKKFKNDYDLVILDEAHSFLGNHNKTKGGVIWKEVSKITKDVPIIYLSATPSAQSFGMLYHQFKLSSWSPFSKWKTFTEWFATFGILQLINIYGRQIRDYTRTKEDLVLSYCKHLFISYSRKELGFKFEPFDEVHWVELSDTTKEIYKQIDKDGFVVINGVEIVADTPMAVILKLHQLEGGTIKMNDNYYILDNTEKIDYILKTFGDKESVVIFYNYQAEQEKLKKYFKKATILQATSYAEGVDLSMFETLVVYSMNFSTAKYTQRRARQANLNRQTPIQVHFILVDKAVSHQVYQCVAINRQNFVDKYYERGAFL